MTSRWEPGDLRTGIIVMLAFIAVVAGVIWGATSKVQDLAPLYADFPTLTGVSTETPVLLNGYRVGQVAGIEPHTDSLGQLTFRVKMAVQWHPGGDKAIPYRHGMKVRLSAPAIDVFGTATLRLEPPKVPGPPLAKGARLPLVQTASPLEGAQVKIDSLGQEITRTLVETRALMAVLSKTAEAAAGTAHATSEVARTASLQMNVLAKDTRLRLATADSLMRDVRTLTPSAKATADSLQGLLGDSRKTMARLVKMADTNEPQLTRTLASLDTSAALLQHFMRQVSARPYRVLTGVSELPSLKAPPRVATDTLRGARAPADKTAQKP